MCAGVGSGIYEWVLGRSASLCPSGRLLPSRLIRHAEFIPPPTEVGAALLSLDYLNGLKPCFPAFSQCCIHAIIVLPVLIILPILVPIFRSSTNVSVPSGFLCSTRCSLFYVHRYMTFVVIASSLVSSSYAVLSLFPAPELRVGSSSLTVFSSCSLSLGLRFNV